MKSSDDAIDLLRIRLAAKPRFSWRYALRNALFYLAVWLIGALFIYGLISLISAAIKVISK